MKTYAMLLVALCSAQAYAADGTEMNTIARRGGDEETGLLANAHDMTPDRLRTAAKQIVDHYKHVTQNSNDNAASSPLLDNVEQTLPRLLKNTLERRPNDALIIFGYAEQEIGSLTPENFPKLVKLIDEAKDLAHKKAVTAERDTANFWRTSTYVAGGASTLLFAWSAWELYVLARINAEVND